jgi:hypothetical protein
VVEPTIDIEIDNRQSTIEKQKQEKDHESMAQLIYKLMQNHQKWRRIQAGPLLQLVYKLRCLYKVGVRRERYVV